MLKHTPAQKFPSELKRMKYEIQDYALEFGLDFFPVIFEVLDYHEINEIAAYSGFPQRYPHWSFGMQFEEVSKSYAYGLSKIYEMVINNDPCYAYLLHSNSNVDQKLVMAHVYGHSDFFKNIRFNKTYSPADKIGFGNIRKLYFIKLYGFEIFFHGAAPEIYFPAKLLDYSRRFHAVH